jgi:predicted HAD superfamily hydrolase
MNSLVDTPQLIDNDFINRVMSSAASCDIVSLDIFDTALTRIVDSPADLFAEIEKQAVQQYGDLLVGLALQREDAERRARLAAQERNVEDITLDQIYAELNTFTKDKTDAIKELELKIEIESVIACQDILQLTRSLNQLGKPWMFVSDMYLSSEFLASVLQRLGYEGWKHLFVSNEVHYTKATGNIWPKVISKYYPLPKILHIGDNSWSDVIWPTKYEVKTIPYLRWESNRRVGANLDPHLLPFSYTKRHVDIQNRVRNTQLTDAEHWQALGQYLGGPFIVAFLRWLDEKVGKHSIKRLYFCARDGHLLHRAWVASRLRTFDAEARYLNISRRPLQITRGMMESTNQYLSPRLLEYLTAYDGQSTIKTIIDRIPDANQDLVKELQKEFTDRKLVDHNHPDGHGGITWTLRQILKKYSEQIYNSFVPLRERTIAYLRQEGLHQDVQAALVDTGWTGGQQRALNHIMGGSSPVMGLYFGMWRPAFNNYHQAGLIETAFANPFEHPNEISDFQMAVNTLETLCSSPEGTTVDYRLTNNLKWVPQTKPNVAEYEQYCTATKYFQQGVLDVVEAVFFGGNFGPLKLEDCTIEAARSAVASVILSPTDKELELIGSLGHCFLTDHNYFSPQIESEFPTSDDQINKVLPNKNWLAGTIINWYKMAPKHEKEWMRRIARERLGHLGERRLRQFWY